MQVMVDNRYEAQLDADRESRGAGASENRKRIWSRLARGRSCPEHRRAGSCLRTGASRRREDDETGGHPGIKIIKARKGKSLSPAGWHAKDHTFIGRRDGE